MDYPIAARAPFPWRTVTLVAVGVAAVELLLLIVVGGALLAKPTAEPKAPARAAAATPATPAKAEKRERARTAAAPAATPAPVAAAELPRKQVRVLVLNGNGRTGAAAAAAARVGSRGYKVSAVANAPRHDYPQSVVLYKRGFGGEAQRLANDLGVKVVGPLDGIRVSELHGAHVVFILGA